MLLLFAIGCGDNKAKIRVGVSISGTTDPDLRLIEKALKENAENYGVQIIYEKDSLEKLLDKGIRVLILSRPDARELEYYVRETHQRGIPVVVLDSPLPQNLQVEAYVKVNHFEAGKLMAEYVMEKLGGNGNVIVLEGPRDDESYYQIKLGMHSVLEKHDSIDVRADESYPNWDEELAADAVRSTLNKYADNIQAVLASSSQLATGAARAIIQRGLADRVITVGIGADMNACKAIMNGTHDMEIDKMPYDRGLEALDLAVAIVNGEDFIYDEETGDGETRTKVKYGPFRLITKQNISVMESTWPQLADKQ